MSGEINRCPQYGWGFDANSDVCKNCKSKGECFLLSMEAKLKKSKGYKPNIPIKKKQKDAYLQLDPHPQKYPHFMGDQDCVVIKIYVSIRWLKKYFSWMKGDDDE